MTVALNIWMAPVAVTVVIWIIALCWPLPKSIGDYSFGRAFAALAIVGSALFASMAVWLLFLFYIVVTR